LCNNVLFRAYKESELGEEKILAVHVRVI